MRMTWGLLLVLICAPSLLVSAQNDANSGVQSKVIALEKAWNQAYKLGDTRALEEILDDRIVLINDDGSIQTKAEFLASVHPAKSQEQQVAPESINVRRVRKHCHRDRSVSSQGSRSWKALRAAGALCRYLGQ